MQALRNRSPMFTMQDARFTSSTMDLAKAKQETANTKLTVFP